MGSFMRKGRVTQIGDRKKMTIIVKEIGIITEKPCTQH